METFSTACSEKYGLTPQYTKTKVFHKSRIFPDQAPTDMKNAREMVGDTWQSGFMCYELLEHLQQLEVKIDKGMDLLSDNHQAAWTLISASLSHQLD